MLLVIRKLLLYVILPICLGLSPNGQYKIKIAVTIGVTDADRTMVDSANALYMMANELNQIQDLIHPNATLQLVYSNSRYDQKYLVPALAELVIPRSNNAQESPEKIIGVIGSTFSRLTRITSILTQSMNIPICCGSSTSPMLTNKQEYPNFFRTVPDDSQQSVVMTNFLVSQKWNRVAIIYTDEDYGRSLAASVLDRCKSNDIAIITEISVDLKCTPEIADQTIKRLAEADDVRVVLYLGYPAQLFQLLKSATAKKMYGPGIVWIGSDANTEIKSLFPDKESNAYFKGLLSFRPLEGAGSRYEKFLKSWENSEFRQNSGFEYANLSSFDRPLTFTTFYASCLELMVKG